MQAEAKARQVANPDAREVERLAKIVAKTVAAAEVAAKAAATAKLVEATAKQAPAPAAAKPAAAAASVSSSLHSLRAASLAAARETDAVKAGRPRQFGLREVKSQTLWCPQFHDH